MSTKQTDSDSAVYLRGAEVHKIVVPMSFLTTDLQAADINIMAELPSNAILTSITSMNDDMDSVADLAFDIGLYRTNKPKDLSELVAADLTVIDVDAYVDGSTSFQAAVATMAEIMNGVAPDDLFETVLTKTGDNVGEEPFKYVLALTVSVSAATAVAGDATFVVTYVQG